jgi:hypothetical protein
MGSASEVERVVQKHHIAKQIHKTGSLHMSIVDFWALALCVDL